MAILSYINVQELNSPPFRIKQSGNKLLGFEGTPEEAHLWRALSESIGMPELTLQWIAEYIADHVTDESAETFTEFTFDRSKGEMYATEKKENKDNASKQRKSLRNAIPETVRRKKRTKTDNRKS